ncbi:Uncharacterized protein PECH_001759 [Penicillium ucsense]|uniref:RAD52 homolog n=1 Tax=Penicillium ucsense TaxID=2839758 RepID=A0A8J8WB60_9EURO|nr:Uncharacterized protein PECM_008058 [Penicillium ucsense]KAF7738116.1 Uncharacterized protein PECH_001759 [Penicillium ucsense]
MPNGPGPVNTNPFEEPERRMSEYTAMQIATLQARLDRKLGPEYISSRPGAAGQKVHYLSADKCINLANEVFGFNGWSSSIQRVDIDFVDENENTGKVSLGLSVIVRVTLKDGSFHEDIGYGHIENCKGKAAAFEKSKKEGTTDALKRALRNFGNVLGNCVYDKDYLSKVTKIKTAPARWDVNELHRHPDFAPLKKEIVPKSRLSEDDDLPLPRPSEPARSAIPSHTAIDGDGEFGSDVFDEADFVVTHTGNPDEIVIEPEQPQQPPTPLNRSYPQAVPARSRFDSNAVTPSKPERWSGANNPGTRQILPPHPRQQPHPPPDQQRGIQAQGAPRIAANANPNAIPPSVNNSNPPPQIKREPISIPNQDSSNQPPPTVGFFSARAADQLRDNPNAAAIPGSQFDPHAESPSIRKTAGIDHTKTVALVRSGNGVSPAPDKGRSRDAINPAINIKSRVDGAAAAPAGGFGSPLSRGQSVSSFRPLTRPNIDSRNAVSTAHGSRAGNVPPQNVNGKRPPLSDVTNADSATGPGTNNAQPLPSSNETKRPRMAEGVPGQPQQRAPHAPQ